MCTNSFLFAAFTSIQGRCITHLLPHEDASSYEQPCYEPVYMSNGTDKKAEEGAVSYKKAEEWAEEFHRRQHFFKHEALRATLQKETGALSINEEADSKGKVNNMDNYKEVRIIGDKVSGNVSHKKGEEMPKKMFENDALRATLQKENVTLSINEEADSKEKVNDMDNYKEKRTTSDKSSRSLSFKENINHRSASSEEKNSHIIYKHDKKAEEGDESYKKAKEEAEEFHRLQKMVENEALRATLQGETGTLSINEEADSKEKVNNMTNNKEERTTGDKASGNISHKEAEEMLNTIFENEALRETIEKESGILSINEQMESKEKVNDVDNYKEERTTGNKASGSLSFMENINHSSASTQEKNNHVIYKHNKKVEKGALSYKKAKEKDEKFHRLQKMIEYEVLRATLQKETGTLTINKEADSKEKVNNMDNCKEEKTTGDKASGYL